MPDRPYGKLLKRIGAAAAACGAVTVSLLVFPSAILWMVAVWIAFFSVVCRRSRYAWLPLATCVAILAVKRPDWSALLTTFTVSMIAVALLSEFPQRVADRKSGVFAWGGIAILWTIWLAALWESRITNHCGMPSAVAAGRPVVCLGDSLTTGLSDAEAYPSYLQQLVRLPVLNLGRAGISSRDALKQLPAILEAKPQVVVIELGGHDFLRGYGKVSTRESLVQIIEACENADADVVLVEIPRGFIVDSFGGLERELSRTYDLELIPDTAIRQLVLRSPTFPLSRILGATYLSDDGLHPNEAGARLLAMQVRDALVRMYGLAIAEPGC